MRVCVAVHHSLIQLEMCVCAAKPCDLDGICGTASVYCTVGGTLLDVALWLCGLVVLRSSFALLWCSVGQHCRVPKLGEVGNITVSLRQM